MINTIEYVDGVVRMIDQTKLPNEKIFVNCHTIEDVGSAIKTMIIRGAPAIGVAAAMGVSLEATAIQADDYESFYSKLKEKCDVLGQSRPTAVNLAWGIDRMLRVVEESKELPLGKLKKRILKEAMDVWEEDIAANKRIGKYGQELIDEGNTILTHCNAGALATAGYGTALGVVRGAVDAGKKVNVIANETRPFLQGARLTVWELKEDEIPVKLITDGMCGHFMNNGAIDRVVVGADRIAGNGDVANKIGTYMVAVLAKRHNIPFYVAAPISTLDLSLSSGKEIPIEERSAGEVVSINGTRVAPQGIDVGHPAFDITPNELVAGIVTDKGVAYPPYTESLKALAEK